MDEKSNHSSTEVDSPQRHYSQRQIAISRLKRKLLKHIWLVRISIVAVLALGIYLVVVLAGLILGSLGVTNYFKLAGDFVFTPQSKISSQEGKSNILILGKSGEGHEAADLTDSIIFASVSHRPTEIAVISLPRDIWIPSIRAKLNSAYYWGEQKDEGGGITLAKALVEEIVGQPVHYGLVIDFSGFIKIIDVIGGVEVNVENSFVDFQFPIPGRENDDCQGEKELKCRYETVSFEKGIQKMDGETALKFARSRNAEGEEGTDIARAARQQKILIAIKQKLLTPSTLLSPGKLISIGKVLKSSTETDIDPSAAAILLRRGLQARNNVLTEVLSEEFLVNPPISPRYDNQYVFLPRQGDWSEVQLFMECFLEIKCQDEK